MQQKRRVYLKVSPIFLLPVRILIFQSGEFRENRAVRFNALAMFSVKLGVLDKARSLAREFSGKDKWEVFDVSGMAPR